MARKDAVEVVEKPRGAEAPREHKVLKTVKDPYAVLVGKRLRKARELAGMQMNEVAQITGYDRQTIGTWENGFSIPPVKKLYELCRLYKCSVEEIIVGAEPEGWEGVAAKMPHDLRTKVFVISRRPLIGELVEKLNEMDDEQLERLLPLISNLRLISAANMEAVEKVIVGMADVIAATRQS